MIFFGSIETNIGGEGREGINALQCLSTLIVSQCVTSKWIEAYSIHILLKNAEINIKTPKGLKVYATGEPDEDREVEQRMAIFSDMPFSTF